MKDAGIIHCDLKPENILLSTRWDAHYWHLDCSSWILFFFSCSLNFTGAFWISQSETTRNKSYWFWISMYGGSDNLLIHSGLHILSQVHVWLAFDWCLYTIFPSMQLVDIIKFLSWKSGPFVLQSRYYRSPEVLLGYPYPFGHPRILSHRTKCFRKKTGILIPLCVYSSWQYVNFLCLFTCWSQIRGLTLSATLICGPSF